MKLQQQQQMVNNACCILQIIKSIRLFRCVPHLQKKIYIKWMVNVYMCFFYSSQEFLFSFPLSNIFRIFFIVYVYFIQFFLVFCKMLHMYLTIVCTLCILVNAFHCAVLQDIQFLVGYSDGKVQSQKRTK